MGICAGAALAGRRPALFVQSSGIGNMINALLSLTQFYELPLALFVSRRGVYRSASPRSCRWACACRRCSTGRASPGRRSTAREDLAAVARELPLLYARGGIHAFLLSPAVWEGSECRGERPRTFGARRSAGRDGGAGRGGGARRSSAGPRPGSRF